MFLKTSETCLSPRLLRTSRGHLDIVVRACSRKSPYGRALVTSETLLPLAVVPTEVVLPAVTSETMLPLVVVRVASVLLPRASQRHNH